eukprot:SAG11_NODE_2273_length_3591_cov_12.261741_1_plen_210_part_10
MEQGEVQHSTTSSGKDVSFSDAVVRDKKLPKKPIKNSTVVDLSDAQDARGDVTARTSTSGSSTESQYDLTTPDSSDNEQSTLHLEEVEGDDDDGSGGAGGPAGPGSATEAAAAIEAASQEAPPVSSETSVGPTAATGGFDKELQAARDWQRLFYEGNPFFGWFRDTGTEDEAQIPAVVAHQFNMMEGCLNTLTKEMTLLRDRLDVAENDK